MKKWYESLFKNYAHQYDNEVYVKGTQQEVDFIEQELKNDTTQTILDIGCGTGRHSIELARRGYRVTGFDLSEAQIKRAQEKAETANVSVNFLVEDARKFAFEDQFDLALMLCEGAFCLMEEDDMDQQILKNAFQALRPNGKLILSALNAFYLVSHPQDEKTRFDLTRQREYFSFDFVDDAGKKQHLECDERYYTPKELELILKMVGFQRVEIFAGEIGHFSRNRLLTTDSFEILAIAHK